MFLLHNICTQALEDFFGSAGVSCGQEIVGLMCLKQAIGLKRLVRAADYRHRVLRFCVCLQHVVEMFDQQLPHAIASNACSHRCRL